MTKRLKCDIIMDNGSIAQLGEHLPYKQRVIGSNPIVPTIFFNIMKSMMESSNQESQCYREKVLGESLILFLGEVTPECGKKLSRIRR